MIKIVIVEDKPPILRNIKQKVQNYNSSLTIVGEAINGQLALPLIKELKPDIVITDIKMPVMDGLQLISEVKKFNSQILYIIISGYDEFDYARKAMQLGVSEYLLKPVTQESVNITLDKVIAIVKAQKEQTEIKLWNKILISSNKMKASDGDIFESLNFIAFLLCAGPYSNFIIDYSHPFNNFWHDIDMSSIILNNSENHIRLWILNGKSANEAVLILGVDRDCEINLEQLAHSLLKDLYVFNSPITIVVGQKTERALEIGLEVQFMRALLQKNLIFGKSSILIKENMSITLDEKNYILDIALEKRLVTFLQGRQKNHFFNEINKAMLDWESKNFTQITIEKLLKQVVRLCKKCALNGSLLTSDTELEIDELLSISKDYASLSRGLHYILDPFWQDATSTKSKGESSKELILQIENHLKLHFSEQVVITDLADMVKLDPAYLSRLFKNAKGVSPMEYLTGLRMEKAKELLLSEPNLILKEITEIVGYNDQYYFSRIFKEFTGVSPSEYKKSNIF